MNATRRPTGPRVRPLSFLLAVGAAVGTVFAPSVRAIQPQNQPAMRATEVTSGGRERPMPAELGATPAKPVKPAERQAGVDGPKAEETARAAQRLGQRVDALKLNAKVIPTVVIVGDAPSYRAAIGAWSPSLRFPVLIDDGTLETRDNIARFIRAFQPTKIVSWKKFVQGDSSLIGTTKPGETTTPSIAPTGDSIDLVRPEEPTNVKVPRKPKKANQESTKKEPPPRIVLPTFPVYHAESFLPINPSDLNSALLEAWDVTPSNPATPQPNPASLQADLLAAWKKSSIEPLGIVVTDTDDPAWPAALALGAARAQPVIFVSMRQNLSDAYAPTEADAVETAIETAVESMRAAHGWSWRGLGDTFDAITICANTPNRVGVGNQESRSTTDRIGRFGTELNVKNRWAWAGSIFGTPGEAAYRAMCSIFSRPTSAWLFDGYENGPPWNQYDCSAAARILQQAGISTECYDTPEQGRGTWRIRASRAIDAGLIFVNTKGNADFFDLEPGQCKPADIPLLSKPAALHFVHSWSLQFPAERATVGGRWLDRGVFAYAGSVNEPFLQAFVPTPTVAERLISGMPFGAAVRIDDGAWWKIATLGDPLYNLGPGYAVDEAAKFPLDDAVTLGDRVPEVLRSGQFDDAMMSLVITGREADALKLAKALCSQPDEITPAVATWCIPVLARAGAANEVVTMYEKLTPELARQPFMRDCLWLTCYPMLVGATPPPPGIKATVPLAPVKPTDAALKVLLSNVRSDNLGRDALNLAYGWKERYGLPAAREMLDALRRSLADPKQIEQLNKAMQSASSKWGE